MSVDWTKPIEAYHTDGRVVTVELDNDYSPQPDVDGDYNIKDGLGIGVYYFYPDGKAHSSKNWNIRNVVHIGDAPDTINSPSHYSAGGSIECIDAIRAALTPEEFRGYCKGNMLKYVWRERSKGGDESLQKAAKYAEFALEKVDG